MAGLTQEEFLRRARAVHGDKYDYSQAVYSGTESLLTVVCRVHGPFTPYAGNHMKGHTCKKCSAIEWGNRARKSQAEYLKEARAVHGYRYDYSKTVYRGKNSPITIICRRHGPFTQCIANVHLSGSGCPQCGYESANRRLTTKEFVRKARAAHGNAYGYKEVSYVTSHTKVKIHCPSHGHFSQTPNSHLGGNGCPRCGRSLAGINRRIKEHEYWTRVREMHGNTYDYSKTKYIGLLEKLEVRCHKHGPFEQSAVNHMDGQGCPRCTSSHGEKEIARILSAVPIPFTHRAKLIPGKSYHFDFHLPKSKTLLEYNGEQHYRLTGFFGGRRQLEYLRSNDRFKARWARRNGYRLIVIPYTVVNIEKYLLNKLFYCKKGLGTHMTECPEKEVTL